MSLNDGPVRPARSESARECPATPTAVAARTGEPKEAPSQFSSY